MILHICKHCSFSTNKKNDYDRHLNSLKHKKNISTNKNIINTDISENTKLLLDIYNNQIQLSRQNEELKKKIELLENKLIK